MKTSAKHAVHPHHHGPKCGHVAVRHGDHIDYLQDGHLHHVHGDHVDEHVSRSHRPIPTVARLSTVATAMKKVTSMGPIAVMKQCRTAITPIT
jgi:hypothetical protein